MKVVSESCVVIAGVGLIGGSIAAAIRERNPSSQVIGIGRSVEKLRHAAQRGLLTEWYSGQDKLRIPAGSFGVVCLPVDRIAESVRMLADAGCEQVTDAGSVKSMICQQVGEYRTRFIGSHPIAGSERSGHEHADPQLFVNRLCIVTPQNHPEHVVVRVSEFWKSLGMAVRLMTPEEHDRVLALTSHLPHVLASVAAACVTVDQLPFTGTGFRDTSRIAAGSGDLWSSILLGNRSSCIDAIRRAENLLREFREALISEDPVRLRDLWESAAAIRRQLDS